MTTMETTYTATHRTDFGRLCNTLHWIGSITLLIGVLAGLAVALTTERDSYGDYHPYAGTGVGVAVAGLGFTGIVWGLAAIIRLLMEIRDR